MASTSDAQGLFALRDDGVALSDAIQIALEDAGLVSCASRHDRSACERYAAIGCFRSRSNPSSVRPGTRPPVTGFKWAFGHLLAASGIIEAVQALCALRVGIVPGIATLKELDPGFCRVASFVRDPRTAR